jgi:Icc-related predicted phosphoesterase
MWATLSTLALLLLMVAEIVVISILHLSDTHMVHDQLKLDLAGIDLVVHSGDATNSRASTDSDTEFLQFIDWYATLPVKHKVFCPGNHDKFCYEKRTLAKGMCEERGIIYLEDEEITIEGIKFYATPWVPKFKNWVYMKREEDLVLPYSAIPDDTQVLITHGPPLGVLDISSDKNGVICIGSSALAERIKALPHLKVHMFGHVHSFYTEDQALLQNTGVTGIKGVLFSNGSCVVNGDYTAPRFHGNWILTGERE